MCEARFGMSSPTAPGVTVAPAEGFRFAAVGRAKEAAGEPALDAVVVTVPASFQAAQRRDTLEAARLAGLHVGDGDLFDEPIAAYIDHFTTRPGSAPAADFQPGRHLLVFDYGGGTCDIALLELADPSGDALLEISPLSISRFHRLGGGDIDAAIVYRALVDQIVEQNGLAPGELGFDDKKNFFEPALRSVAESLKIGLCRETKRRRELDDFELNAYIRGARAAEDEARIAQGLQERERRNTPLDPANVGELPIMPNGG